MRTFLVVVTFPVIVMLLAALLAGVVAQQTSPSNTTDLQPSVEQQAQFQQAQRNVVDAQNALVLAEAQRLTVVYKIRSELGAPESKYEARLAGELLAFRPVAKPLPSPSPSPSPAKN